MILVRSHVKAPNCPKCESLLKIGANENNPFHFLWTCSNKQCYTSYDVKTGIETVNQFPMLDPKFSLNWHMSEAVVK